MFIEFIDDTHSTQMLINTDTLDEVIDPGQGYTYTVLRFGTTLRTVRGKFATTCDTLRAAGCKIVPLLEGEVIVPKKGKKK